MRSFVVGDIHGCLDELSNLLATLPLEGGDRLIFLGDYIDRGPDSKGVVSHLLKLREIAPSLDLIFLKGNHEDMLLSYLGLAGQHGDMFLVNGGKATLESYGLHAGELTPADALSAISATHLDFYRSLKSYYIIDNFLCVHAGIDPLKPLERQTDSDMFWIRHSFIQNPHPLPYTVLFGHTPRDEIYLNLPYKIGLDTGLVYGNKLTCLEISEKIIYQIARSKRDVLNFPIRDKWHGPSPSCAS